MIRLGVIVSAALMVAGSVVPSTATEATANIRCEPSQEAASIDQRCDAKTGNDTVSIVLPDDIHPVETGSLLNTLIKVPLPQDWLGTVTVPTEELADSFKSKASSAETDRPATAITNLALPDVRLSAPDLPPLAVIPPETTPSEKAPVERQPQHAGTMPADVLQAAIRKLKGNSRLGDKDIAGVAQFYASRDNTPAWIDNGQWNAAAKAVRARLQLAAEDGLDPAHYRSVSAFVGDGQPQWPALAAAEVQLTDAVVRYARDAAIGRIDPSQVHALITPTRSAPFPTEILAQVTGAVEAGEALQLFNPPHSAYGALRRKLAALRAEAAAPLVESIPDGPALRVGMRDYRVPLIRARLGLGYDGAAVYDRNLAIKVAGLQKSAGLPVNGLFTPQTRRALAGELPSPDEAEIIANMERWRWLPRELGEDHIFVNVPELSLEMKKAGIVVHSARVIIGKNETQTPVFSDMMDHIVVNPSWFVPPSILKKDPRYLDPVWTEARGYTLRKRGDVVTVRVPPSASNALGNVKFMFPNHHAVYLHDTPGRHLFNARNRLLSNGCVRVENPFRLAAALFAEEGWSEERFRKQVGGGERMMKLRKKLPIHIAYFTMSIDDSGQLMRHNDVYGHSLRLRQLLGLS